MKPCLDEVFNGAESLQKGNVNYTFWKQKLKSPSRVKLNTYFNFLGKQNELVPVLKDIFNSSM